VTNEVLIAGRGYARAKELRACAEPGGANPRDFIVRAGWKSLALRDPAGDPFDVIAHLETLAAGSGPAEWAVQAVIDARRPDDVLPIRLVVVSLPPDIPAREIYAPYRLRRQIELAFKRMKSLIHIDRLPTRTAAGGLCWLYAHLILTLLTEDICQDSWNLPPEDLACEARHSPWRTTKLVLSAVTFALAGVALTFLLHPRIGAHTNGSPILGDGGKGKCFLHWTPYPDAYAAKPGERAPE